MVAKNKPNEIYITRVYDFPVQVVWDAWTDPEQVAKWWGPRGFSITTHSKDLRTGGTWVYTMHGPDGTNYPNKTLYHEVEINKKLVYDHGGNDDRPPLFHVTVLFSESNGKTTMEMVFACSTAEEATSIRRLIREAEGNSTWDRLAEYLDETERSKPSFVINRSFEAPPDVLFDHFSNAARLSKWLPTPDLKIDILRDEFQEGGSTYFRMNNQEYVSVYGELTYREIAKSLRIETVVRFCDEQEKTTPHPAFPDFPALLFLKMNLTPESENGTRVTLTIEPTGSPSMVAIESFLDLRGWLTKMWNRSFDRLDSNLM